MNRRPSLAQRLGFMREAIRGIWQGPIYSSDPNLTEFFGTHKTATGVSVSEGTAMTYAAVWSAVNCISGDTAALPLNKYRRIQGGGKEKFQNDPQQRMIHDKPNPEMTSMVWRRVVQAHALTWGNGYSEIVRDGSGRPSQMWPITPDRVTPYRRGSDSGLEYRVVNRDGSDAFIPASDMLHIPGLGFDGVQGYSVIHKARESIGLGMAAEGFGSRMYGNGLAIGGVISYPGGRPPEMSEKNYLATLNSQHQGVDRAHKLLALYNGAKYERMNIPPNDAQFLETRKFQISEIARWFNLPPHKLGDLERATHSNIEQQTIDYYTGTLLPWLTTWEQELNLKLVPDLERNIQFFEHVIDGLLRGDSQSRADAFSKQFNTASLRPNEIRDMENRNPIPGGDTAFVPLNTIPLHLAEPWFLADIDEKKAKAEQARRPPPAPVAPHAAPAPDNGREIELLTEARDTARRCAQEAEDAKDVIAAELVALKVERAHEQSQWDSERTTLTTTLATRDEMIETMRTQMSESETRCGELATVRDGLTADVERLTAQATSLGTDLGTAQRDLTAMTERAAMIEADYQRVCDEKARLIDVAESGGRSIFALEAERVSLQERTESLSLDVAAAQQETTRAAEQIATLVAEAERMTAVHVTAHEAHQTEASDLRSQLATVTEELTSVTASLQEARTAIGTLETAREADRATAATEAQRLAEARTHADEVNQATVAELRSQLATMTQELAATTASLFEVRTSLGAAEGARESVREAWTAADQEATRQTALVESFKARLSATQAAIRATIIDAGERLIAKEAERARKAQASPEKLGAWVHTFYPIHEDFCRVALKPAVRAALVAQGSEASVDRVLDSVVLSHISESSRQLQAVIQDSDIESLGPSLERVLRRWEAERAEALADRILKEAV